MRTILRAVDQYYRMLNPSIELKLKRWTATVEDWPWSSGDDMPDAFMSCNGSSDVQALVNELGNPPECPVVILSDGYWNDSAAFNEWAERCQEGLLRVILLGADANRKLKADYVFKAERLLAALEGLGE
ncbi:hypothetical protein [Xiamenia xianingshaonis]|uniref:hypothetical protein n=1 Tax=Xiamenia xianingshaonis TaxID=2682776 RepID=UPI001407DB10|nr:hypothetical protein [Xiamenia xianingshaonis]